MCVHACDITPAHGRTCIVAAWESEFKRASHDLSILQMPAAWQCVRLLRMRVTPMQLTPDCAPRAEALLQKHLLPGVKNLKVQAVPAPWAVLPEPETPCSCPVLPPCLHSTNTVNVAQSCAWGPR